MGLGKDLFITCAWIALVAIVSAAAASSTAVATTTASAATTTARPATTTAVAGTTSYNPLPQEWGVIKFCHRDSDCPSDEVCNGDSTLQWCINNLHPFRLEEIHSADAHAQFVMSFKLYDFKGRPVAATGDLSRFSLQIMQDGEPVDLTETLLVEALTRTKTYEMRTTMLIDLSNSVLNSTSSKGGFNDATGMLRTRYDDLMDAAKVFFSTLDFQTGGGGGGVKVAIYAFNGGYKPLKIQDYTSDLTILRNSLATCKDKVEAWNKEGERLREEEYAKAAQENRAPRPVVEGGDKYSTNFYGAILQTIAIMQETAVNTTAEIVESNLLMYTDGRDEGRLSTAAAVRSRLAELENTWPSFYSVLINAASPSQPLSGEDYALFDTVVSATSANLTDVFKTLGYRIRMKASNGFKSLACFPLRAGQAQVAIRFNDDVNNQHLIGTHTADGTAYCKLDKDASYCDSVVIEYGVHNLINCGAFHIIFQPNQPVLEIVIVDDQTTIELIGLTPAVFPLEVKANNNYSPSHTFRYTLSNSTHRFSGTFTGDSLTLPEIGGSKALLIITDLTVQSQTQARTFSTNRYQSTRLQRSRFNRHAPQQQRGVSSSATRFTLRAVAPGEINNATTTQTAAVQTTYPPMTTPPPAATQAPVILTTENGSIAKPHHLLTLLALLGSLLLLSMK